MDFKSHDSPSQLADFFDSPQPNFDLPDSEKSFSGFDAKQEEPRDDSAPRAEPRRNKTPKINKETTIRTSRNAQKIYHNILRQWL